MDFNKIKTNVSDFFAKVKNVVVDFFSRFNHGGFSSKLVGLPFCYEIKNNGWVIINVLNYYFTFVSYSSDKKPFVLNSQEQSVADDEAKNTVVADAVCDPVEDAVIETPKPTKKATSTVKAKTSTKKTAKKTVSKAKAKSTTQKKATAKKVK